MKGTWVFFLSVDARAYGHPLFPTCSFQLIYLSLSVRCTLSLNEIESHSGSSVHLQSHVLFRFAFHLIFNSRNPSDRSTFPKHNSRCPVHFSKKTQTPQMFPRLLFRVFGGFTVHNKSSREQCTYTLRL